MSGDEHESFRDLYTEHYPAVLGYCLRRAHRDSAPDLASEVFAVAWRRRSGLPEGDLVLPWLYAVAARTIANHRRSLRRRTRLVERVRRLGGSSEVGPETLILRRSEDAAVIEAVERLRPSDREILLLSAWEGLSAAQIAARFAISLHAAEKRLTRAKQRFRSELARADRTSHHDVARRGEAL